jgi:hypothetical protein
MWVTISSKTGPWGKVSYDDARESSVDTSASDDNEDGETASLLAPTADARAARDDACRCAREESYFCIRSDFLHNGFWKKMILLLLLNLLVAYMAFITCDVILSDVRLSHTLIETEGLVISVTGDRQDSTVTDTSTDTHISTFEFYVSDEYSLNPGTARANVTTYGEVYAVGAVVDVYYNLCMFEPVPTEVISGLCETTRYTEPIYFSGYYADAPFGLAVSVTVILAAATAFLVLLSVGFTAAFVLASRAYRQKTSKIENYEPRGDI